MSKKVGNKELFIILIILIGVYALVRYINHKRGENTFHTAIIPKVDTNSVTDMYIYLNTKGDEGKPLHFFKSGNYWMVTQNGYTTRADERAETNVVEQIQQISPDRLATNNPAQWKEFRVIDTMGTRLVMLNHKDTAIDMIVGKFGYNMQARQGISYLRLHGQKEVYGVTGFLSMSITEDVDSWRDRKVIYMEDNDWNRLTFTYPGDSSYTIQKDTMGKWHFADGAMPDSIAVKNNLTTMSRQNYGKFVYNFDTNKVKPAYSIKLDGKGLNPIIINAYPADSTNKYVITSSMNPGAYFSGAKTGMFKSLFFNKAAFMHHNDLPKPSAARAMPHKAMMAKRKK